MSQHSYEYSKKEQPYNHELMNHIFDLKNLSNYKVCTICKFLVHMLREVKTLTRKSID